MFPTIARVLIGVLITSPLLSACQHLPKAGPGHSDIQKKAAYHLTTEKQVLTAQKGVETNYVLVDLSEAVTAYFKPEAQKTLGSRFGGSSRGAPMIKLGVGDIVEITLFESSAGGLFIPAEAGSRPGNFISLPQQRIDGDGTLTVPYAGRVAAKGKTAATVQREIEQKLASRAIEPQVVINLIESRSSEVSVLGDVGSPAKLDINPGGERILDLISRAGGISEPGAETIVTLQRGGTTASANFETLLNNPRENIFVYPRDTIYVNRDRRTYLALGASGVNGRINFEESDLTLAEAVATAGGLLDSRADPGQVFLYRVVETDDLKALGAPVSKDVSGRYHPVIFKANLRDPSVLFLAQQFPMVDKDVLYVSNANSVQITKFLNLLNNVTGGTVGPIEDAATGKTSIRTLQRN